MQLENTSCSRAFGVIGYQLLSLGRNNGGFELPIDQDKYVPPQAMIDTHIGASAKLAIRTDRSGAFGALSTGGSRIFKNPVDRAKRPTYMHRRCPDGGIGRRAGFRYLCREAWRFESSSGHQIPFLDRPTWSENTTKSPVVRAFCFLASSAVLWHPRFLLVPLWVHRQIPTCRQTWIPTMALTDTSIRGLKAASKPAKHSDGGGLHLVINPTGSKLWRLGDMSRHPTSSRVQQAGPPTMS